MEKIYTYKNATITITKPTEENIECIKKSTTNFSKQVIKERSNNGNVNTSRTI